ncbi:MAG: hypothetical protein M1451_01055, partial [Acidobacteria bacterium]|nr:hypothetical protein [Acidobacteriota bacterium]
MIRSLQRIVLFAGLLLATAGLAEAQNPGQGAGLPDKDADLKVGRTKAAAQQAASVDFEQLSSEAAGWLSGLLAINTTNPPGNELAAAKYISAILEKEGIAAEVIESAPGRGIVIARLRAGAVPDPSRALLLLGHTDVVGVDRAKWTVEPFGGIH